jgi:hypothetical protein
MRRGISALLFTVLGFTPALAQVELNTFAEPNGMINVQTLTCKQLASTFQEDADMLAAWYSGWYNGLAKKHYANFPRVKAGLHDLIVSCKNNQNQTVIHAIDVLLKSEHK